MRWRRWILLAVAAAAVPVAGAGEPAVSAQAFHPFAAVGELTLSIGQGHVDYRESVSLAPVRSSWDASASSLALRWAYDPPTRFLARVEAGLWSSARKQEVWRERGEEVQRNRMDASGWDLLGQWGYALMDEPAGRLAVLAGLGYRVQTFDRGGFRLLGEEEIFLPFSVRETFNLADVRLGAEALVPLGGPWTLRAAGGMGWVVFDEADNDLFGSLSGDGGWIGSGEIEVRCRPGGRHAAGLALRLDHQKLDGTRDGVFTDAEGVPAGDLEWPANRLSRWLVEFRWTIAL